jgi:hypothetical protein
VDLGSPKQIRFAPAGTPNFVEIPKTFAEMQYTGAFASPSKSISESDEDTYEIPDKAFADLVSFPDDEDFEPRNPIQDPLKSRPKSILKDVPSRTGLDEIGSGKPEGFSPKLGSLSLMAQLSLVDEDDGFNEDDLDADSVVCQNNRETVKNTR